jgi:hypothetical protein
MLQDPGHNFFAKTLQLRRNPDFHSNFRNVVFEGCFICGLLWAEIQRGGNMDSFKDADRFSSCLWLDGEQDNPTSETLVLGIHPTIIKTSCTEVGAVVSLPLEPLGLLGNEGFLPSLNTPNCQSKKSARLGDSYYEQQRPTEMCDAISSSLHLHGHR